MLECFCSYLWNSARNTGCAATEPDPIRVFALAAAGIASATMAATPTARILRITSVDSFLRGRPVASLIGGAESSTFLSLLIVLVGKAPRKRECVCQPAPTPETRRFHCSADSP